MSEFFSSVGNFLITENEKLTTMFISPTIFIEAWLIFHLFTLTLNIEYTKKQKFIYIFLVSISSLLAEFLVPSPYNSFVNYIVNFTIIKIVFRTNFTKSLLALIIPTVIMALISSLAIKPILLLFHLTLSQIETIPLYRLIYIICIYSIIFIVVKLIQFRKKGFSWVFDFSGQNKIIILTNLFLGIFTLCIQAFITEFYTDTLPLHITVLSFVSLLAYFFISFYSLIKILELQITTQALENAENYNTTLGYLYDNVKAFHHDFDNMLFIIGGFIDNNDIYGLKKYYKNLEKDGERVNEVALLNPKIINNSGIYNLLMSKYKKAHSLNVEIKLDFFFDFNRLQMPIYEFSRILGILLDNSIEAAGESKEKQVNIMFRDSSTNSTQIISVENTYANKNVDTSKIFEKGKTSKENHTGMGLWEVSQILKRHNNVVLNTTKDKKYFKQTLEIHY